MPPKRRRKIHGLYYHSSPPKVITMSNQMKPKIQDNGKEAIIIKPSNIRIWIHDKDIGKLCRVLWEGQGNRLRTEVSSNNKVKKFLEAVPFVMNTIKEIHSAVVDNNLELLITKTESAPNILLSSKDVNGLTIMHKAVGLAHTRIVEYLLVAYPDGAVECDFTGKTPLHWAASAKNNNRIYNLLVQSGGDEQSLDFKMKTPAYYKNKPNDIDRSLLTVIPDAPRVPSSGLPAGTEWNLFDDDDSNKNQINHNNMKKSKSMSENSYNILSNEPPPIQSQMNLAKSTSDILSLNNNNRSPITPRISRSPSSQFNDNIDDNPLNILESDTPLTTEEQAVLVAIDPENELIYRNLSSGKPGTPESLADELADLTDNKYDDILNNGPMAANTENEPDESGSNNNNNEPDILVIENDGNENDKKNNDDDKNDDDDDDKNNNNTNDDIGSSNGNHQEPDDQRGEEALNDTEAIINPNDNDDNDDNDIGGGNEKSVTENENDDLVDDVDNIDVVVEGLDETDEKNEDVEENNDEGEEIGQVDENDEETNQVDDNDEENCQVDEENNQENDDETTLKEDDDNNDDDNQQDIDKDEQEQDEIVDNNIEITDADDANEENNNEGENGNESQNNDEPDGHDNEDKKDENGDEATNGKENGDDDDDDNKDIDDDEEQENDIAAERDKEDGDNDDDDYNDEEENQRNDKNDSPSPALEIKGVVRGEADNGGVQSEGGNPMANGNEEEESKIKSIISSGDMEQLASLVLNGEGRKLISMTSEQSEIQAFLENVPAYMNKIRRVHLAAREGSLRDLQSALDRRKFAVAKDEISPKGATPLHVATIFGHTGIVRYLAGRFPETTSAFDDNSRTALHYAALIEDNGHFFNLLTHLGANPKAIDNLGNAAEFYTDHEKSENILSHRQLLIDFGADDELVDDMLADQEKIRPPPTPKSTTKTETTISPSNNGQIEIPIFRTEEGRYLASTLGDPLIKGLTEVANSRPQDPIGFLANYLQGFSNQTKENDPNVRQGTLKTEATNKENNNINNNGIITSQKSNNYDIDDEFVQGDDSPELAITSDDRDEHGQSLLHFACARSHGRNALIQLIDESGVSLAYRDELYRTARDVSQQAGQPENAKEIDRYILGYAARDELLYLETLLIEGYDHISDIVDNENRNIEQVARSRGHIEVADFLDEIKEFEETREMLHRDIRYGNIIKIKQTLSRSDGNKLSKAKNYYGRCSLHVAVLKENEDIVDFISTNFKQTLRIGDNLDRTALHYAMGVSNVEALSRILIKNGAKRVLKDLKGRQPSYYFMNKADIIRLKEEEEVDDEIDEEKM